MRPPPPPRVLAAARPGRTGPGDSLAPEVAAPRAARVATDAPAPDGAAPATAPTRGRAPGPATTAGPSVGRPERPSGALSVPEQAGPSIGGPEKTGRARARREKIRRSGTPVPARGRTWAGTALARLSASPGVVSTQLAERLAERRAARRRLRLARAAVLAVVAAGAAAVAWLVLASPLLALRSDRVLVSSSAPSADAADVAAALEPWAGTPLARLDTRALRDVVEEVPGVRSATVRRAWPRGLAVDVEARVPAVAAPTGDRFVLLDVDGVQVGELTNDAPDGVPVVSLPQGRSVEGLSAVLAVLDSLPPELLAELREVQARSAETVTFRLADGALVEWGSVELSDLKVEVLAVLRQRPAEVYDVSAPTMPVTRGAPVTR